MRTLSLSFSIFVKSERASLRVKDKVTNFVERKLHLKINEQKSQICRPIQYFMLGYGFRHNTDNFDFKMVLHFFFVTLCNFKINTQRND